MENTTTRITTLEEHRKLLRMVFETAQSKVLVVSPFISKSAIDHDRIPNLVNKATRRGVSVDIYTDDALNLDTTGNIKSAARSGVASLLEAGAHVTVVQGIHNKTLARDNDLIAEGSFNWLSAVRTSGGVHQREERTMLVVGEQAKEMIEAEIQALGNKSAFIAVPNSHGARNKGVFIVIAVVTAVLLSILFFIGGPTKWWYFGFFAVGLSPYVISALLPKRCGNFVLREGGYHPPDLDLDAGYIPGIRDFDGTFFAEKENDPRLH